MKRRAQFYIFGAVILIALASTLMMSSNQILQFEESFLLLTDNFLTEAPFVVSSARINSDDVSVQFRNFSDEYLEYARSVDPEFGMMLTLQVDDKVYVVNYLGEEAEVNISGIIIESDFNATLR